MKTEYKAWWYWVVFLAGFFIGAIFMTFEIVKYFDTHNKNIPMSAPVIEMVEHASPAPDFRDPILLHSPGVTCAVVTENRTEAFQIDCWPEVDGIEVDNGTSTEGEMP